MCVRIKNCLAKSVRCECWTLARTHTSKTLKIESIKLANVVGDDEIYREFQGLRLPLQPFKEKMRIKGINKNLFNSLNTGRVVGEFELILQL